MTVSELIEQLRGYARDGHGDQEVTVKSAVWDFDPVVDVEYVRDPGTRDDRGVIQLTSQFYDKQ